jgi:hypothetical protein
MVAKLEEMARPAGLDQLAYFVSLAKSEAVLGTFGCWVFKLRNRRLAREPRLEHIEKPQMQRTADRSEQERVLNSHY